MTGTTILNMLFGAALVALGVLAAALADRIRGLRVARRDAEPRERAARAPSVPVHAARTAIPVVDAEPRERAARAPSVPVHTARTAIPVVDAELVQAASPKPRTPRPEPKVAEGGDDVIAALVAAGYKRGIATEAAWACSAAERATVEGWVASALRRCARGGLS